MARARWVKSSMGHRIMYSAISSISTSKGNVWIKGEKGEILAIIEADDMAEELKLLNEQMDAIENEESMPA